MGGRIMAIIKNEKQYRITLEWIAKFTGGLEFMRNRPDDGSLDPALRQAQIDCAASEIEALQGQVRDYEELQRRPFHPDELRCAQELPLLLIKARQSQQLTQQDLAALLGRPLSEIQHYEDTEYASATLETIQGVATVLSGVYGIPPEILREVGIGPHARKGGGGGE